GLGAEDIFSHAPSECRAKSFALRALHQNDQHHQKRDQDINRQQEIYQDLHRGRGIWTMSEQKQPPNAERPTWNVEFRSVRRPTFSLSHSKSCPAGPDRRPPIFYHASSVHLPTN